MRTIRVRAVDGGWAVESDLDLGPLAFLSGAAAERQAIRLASMVVDQGQLAQVIIHDRAGLVIGSRVAGPPLRLAAQSADGHG